MSRFPLWKIKIFFIKALFLPKQKQEGIIALSRTQFQQKKMAITIQTYAELCRLKPIETKPRGGGRGGEGLQKLLGNRSVIKTEGAHSEFVAGGQESLELKEVECKLLHVYWV